MITILREADRTTVAEVAKKHKVIEPTIYAARKHFGHMEAAQAARAVRPFAFEARLGVCRIWRQLETSQSHAP